jgi:hypothetical protein
MPADILAAFDAGSVVLQATQTGDLNEAIRIGFDTVTDPDLGEKPVVPGDHFMFISTDSEYEAHFLCALLNSAVYQRSLGEIASDGKSSLSKSVVSKLALPAYRETAACKRLAELSMEAHEIVPRHTDVSKRAYNDTTIERLEIVQAEIDRRVENLVSEGSLFADDDRETPASG